jgi:hypothetical protein
MMNLGKKESFAEIDVVFNLKKIVGLISVIVCISILFISCKKEKDPQPPDPSDNLALDSIVASKKVIETVEEITITAYARGRNLSYQWEANHGTLISADSVTVGYWACYSCAGLNTIECTVSNEYGSISDTIMIRVY